jgi:hypothetical protein
MVERRDKGLEMEWSLWGLRCAVRSMVVAREERDRSVLTFELIGTVS